MLLDTMGRTLPVPWTRQPRETTLRQAMRSALAAVDRVPALRRAFERVEYWGKRPLFGCEACGNCVLGHMEYVCPQTCPKQMRNGPCGGTFNGRCEVVEQECIWVSVYQRAEAVDRVGDLRTFIPAPDRRLRDTASWINYFLTRDSRPGHPRPVDATTAPVEPERDVDNQRGHAPQPFAAPEQKHA